MIRSLAYLKRAITSLVKRTVRRFGYELVSDSSNYMTMDGGIGRLKERGIVLQSVIDVGASNGRWSELCMKHFPDANYHLFEAQKEYLNQLTAFRSKYPKVDFSLCVAGKERGTIFFDDHIVGGGSASQEKVSENYRQFEASTIDYEVKKRGLKGPFFIKLDTHGYEAEILAGAKETLKETRVVLVECYNFPLNPNSVKFEDMVRFMEGHGFRCMDIVDLALRKKDKMLWQMDIFFARAELPQFTDTQYE